MLSLKLPCIERPKTTREDKLLPSVVVATCLSSDANADAASKVVAALKGLVDAELVVLSNHELEGSPSSVFIVPEGTKLSKLRRFAVTVRSDLICICDPDLTVRSDAIRVVVDQAIAVAECGEEVVVFGLIDCRDNGSLLYKVVSIDKWLSHRVFRPLLWKCGVGITLPGQFLVLSTTILQRLNPRVDSYLDDLYLGWIARSTSVRVKRLPEVIGFEESRSTWGSLLTQRIRWMRGFVSLVWHLSSEPKALVFLFAHFAAYHGLPILWLICFVTIAMISPVVAIGIGVLASCLVGWLSQKSFATSVSFLVLFPLLHCLAVLLWWVPISHRRLMQR